MRQGGDVVIYRWAVVVVVVVVVVVLIYSFGLHCQQLRSGTSLPSSGRSGIRRANRSDSCLPNDRYRDNPRKRRESE